MLRKILASPRWLIACIIVLAACAVMIRLGFWQLDRLAERKALNAQVQAAADAPAISLNAELTSARLTAAGLTDLQYHNVTVTGQYRPAEQVILRNQVYGNLPGYHLLTPLAIEGSDYVILVDRGWLPLDQSHPADWVGYAQPGSVTLTGKLQLPQNHSALIPADPTLTPAQSRLDVWTMVNLTRIASQVQGKLLPVYLIRAADPAASAAPATLANLPLAQPLQVNLSEGSHLSYAIQWFSFTAILLFGFPTYLRAQLSHPATPPQAPPHVRQGG